MGKSTALDAQRTALEQSIRMIGGALLPLNLRAYRSETRLHQALFENRTFEDWRAGTHSLHLLLDNLDECLIRIDTATALIVEELRQHPVERLFLHVACRTADWPSSFEDELRKIWGIEAVQVFELAPLRRRDAVAAAAANNLDPGRFLSEIDRAGGVPLAIKPVTLSLPLNTYQRSGQLPSTQAALYEQGCLLLCEESNRQRRDVRLTGSFSADQRLAVAERIAAVTIFANRYAVWSDVDQGNVPDEDVTLRMLSAGAGNAIEMSEPAMREALATGLFSARGRHRLGWAHQTYAEFLAARHLARHDMPLAQIMSLLVHPNDPTGRLLPQLHETVAWLASMRPDVFHAIMAIDPEVLLRSDIATADESVRSALVESLLWLFDAEQLHDRDPDLHRRYPRLAHSGLADQLRPYIINSNRGILVQRVAMDIAEACELQALQDALANIVLDPSQPYPARVNAVAAR